ncbi:MAG: hypothetical protein JOZ37_05265 [Actinobacteria bacterium]|nr:hypothetical protein [Actinomycetota bacterium]MBV9663355.1 hypothetical protein [Actinomycetota bacterium]MBV9936710.1 hypothetical protein [Actinomycetota bacterium]
MDDRLTDFGLRALAAVLTVAGLVVVLIGYLGVRNQSHVELQLPYLISGGIGGLVLLGLGALTLIQYQMRVQARRFTEMTDALDEWKDQALAELRGFLEGAEIDVEVLAPASTNGRGRRTTAASR